jgi:hypothetical protein
MRKFIFSPSFLYLLPILMMLVVLNGCTKKLTKTDVVYENDFERLGQQTVKIFDFYGPVTTSKIFDFNGSKVLGPFNNNAAIFKTKKIPDHNVLEISFDLYIHDGWQGNTKASNGVPDLFVMKYDGNTRFLTTFANQLASKQSYPQWYPAADNPTYSNAIDIKLPGRCAWKDSTNGTSLYKIVQSFGHASDTFELSLSDALQPFAAICEKSWSIDDLKITAYKYF